MSDEFKEQAGEVFKQLNAAYKNKDIKAVNKILNALKTNKGFSIFSDTVSDADKLRSRIDQLRSKIDIIIEQIAQIKKDETYLMIEIISDWDVYFNDLKSQLREELARLKEAFETQATTDGT